MSWGAVNAEGNTGAKLEHELNKAANDYFDALDFDELADKGGRQQAKNAAKGARALFEAMEPFGNVQAHISGHVRVGGAGSVPGGIAISLVELDFPEPEPVDNEIQPEMSQISAENGENQA